MSQNRSSEQCTVCGAQIQVQINRGSGICSERCRKASRVVSVP